MRKKSILGIIALIGLSSFVVLGSSPGLLGRILESVKDNSITRMFSSETNSEKPSDKIQKPDELPLVIKEKIKQDSHGEIPEFVLWNAVFSLPAKLEESEKQAKLNGKDDSLWKRFFIRQAKLSEGNTEILKETAAQYGLEIKGANERIKGLIENIRVQKDLSQRKALIELQNQKNETTLRYRDKLRKAIGEESFLAFEKWIKEDFSKGFKSLQLPPEIDLNTGYQENPDQGFKRFDKEEIKEPKEENKK